MSHLERIRDSGASPSSSAACCNQPADADALHYSYPVTDRHRRDAGATFTDYITNRSTGP